ncbi:choice-of-anchor L domain-containing protein [Sorangium sp. So ce134]
MILALPACSDSETPPKGGTGTTSSGSSAGGGQGGETGGTGSGGTGGTGGGGTGGIGSTTVTSSSGVAGSGGAGGAPLPVDQDGDGWTVADGDCCDVAGIACAEPELVNPGAFEYLGNQLDDDCDPATPDDVPVADCGGAPLTVPTSSLDLVKALDLCQVTSEDAPLPQRKWGVISNALLTADGAGVHVPSDAQVGVLGDYGSQVSPRKGRTMVALSSGTARDPGDPGHVYPQNGLEPGQVGNFDGMTQTSAPPDYLHAHGGALPSAAACPPCAGASCDQSFDSVNLKVRIRVPTNARSLSYDFKFYSAEFPELLCGNYNDSFVTLLRSNEPTIPLDRNIAFDATNSPISVNNAFFEVCFPPMGSPPGTCPSGTLELVGTGMGGWGNRLTDGGGTPWLTNDAPVVPGETIELEFILWDAGDQNVDSLVLLDKFRWNLTPSAVQVHR